MPSPFPGMDPYLESHWGDMHTRLTLYACDQIQPQLPGGLKARVEEYLTVEADETFLRYYVPDVRIIERPPEFSSTAASAAVAVAEVAEAEEPFVIEAIAEPRTLRSIRIVDTQSGHRVVTAIEFLGPVQKRGRRNRRQYRALRRAMFDFGANIVEIDLTRQGWYILAAPASIVPSSHRTTYRACVIRAAHRHRFEISRLPLDRPLPTIQIPLRPTDADVRLKLQELIVRAWQPGSYDDINYRADPEPRLRGPDAAWAEALLKARGLRQ